MKTFEDFWSEFVARNPKINFPASMKETALMGYTWATESVSEGASSKDLLRSSEEALFRLVSPQ